MLSLVSKNSLFKKPLGLSESGVHSIDSLIPSTHYSSTRRISALWSLPSHSQRLYAARTRKYAPKYADAGDKSFIEPKRILDPSKERSFEHTTRGQLAYEDVELSEVLQQSFDLDLGSREIDPETISDADLEELARQQMEREESNRELLDRHISTKPGPKRTEGTSKNKRNAKLVPKPIIMNNTASPKSTNIEESTQSATQESGEDQEPGIQRKPLVAIVGRPNVGKSTLFNRLIKKSKSLITNTAGTTRDRKYGGVEWEDYELMFVDTGGMLGEGDEWAESITDQALVAIEEADLIVMLTDFVEGVVDTDRTLARMLRRTSKPVFLAVNKCDNEQRYEATEVLNTFRALGLGAPYPISASHGIGTPELLDALMPQVRTLGFKPIPQDDLNAPTFPISKDKLVTSSAFNADGSRKEIRVALVGVPNVGKSSLLNQILGSKRSVVSARPGTTTDPVDEHFMWKGSYPITIIDTAGVRKKKSQEGHVERLSALWSLKVIESSHVCILMLDATAGAQAQDVRLSSYIIDNYRSCVVVINKWDLAPDRSLMGMQAYEEQLRERLQFWYYVPIVFSSAQTGFNVDSIMAWAIRVSDERRVHLATRKLFQIIEQASIVKLPPANGKRRMKFRYCTQVNLGGSPTFVFFVNFPELADGPYKRFLEGYIRQNYAYTGTPIRLMFRKNEGRTLEQRETKRREANKAARKASASRSSK
jgi:GTP-binding protein